VDDRRGPSIAAERTPHVPRPGDGLLHPVALAALATLLVNDQLLKRLWPGLLTGKLSDVAGLIVAPLALQAAWEVARWAFGRWQGPTRRSLVAAIVAVGLGFAAVQVWPPASEAYRVSLGVLQWPLRVAVAIVSGGSVPAPAPVVATADAEDLVALPALAVTWWMGRRRAAR
jgi:hypothetical protein